MKRIAKLQAALATLLSEEQSLRKEASATYDNVRSTPGGKMTEAQAKRDDDIKARLDAIATERKSLEDDIANEKALAEIDRNTTHARKIEVGETLEAQKPWANDGEFYQAVAVAYGARVPGRRAGDVDIRLLAGPSGGSTGVPADGGFLVGKDRSLALLDKADEMAKLLPLCDGYEVSEGSDGVEFPTIEETSRATGSRWGAARVYRRKEAQAVAAMKVKYGDFDVRLEDMMALCYMTGRQLQDAALTKQIVEKAVSSEFAFAQDNEIIHGDGAGEMTGILNSGATVTIAAEAGQVAGSIVSKNISKMWVAMPTSEKPNSVWVHNGELGTTLDELFIPAGLGALEPRFINYGPDGILRIKGRPVLEIEQASAPGTVGDFMLLSLKQYLVVRKGGMQAAESMHVRFLQDEMAFRFTIRVNGRSKWRTSKTPFKGSVNKSPFVLLGAR